MSDEEAELEERIQRFAQERNWKIGYVIFPLMKALTRGAFVKMSPLMAQYFEEGITSALGTLEEEITGTLGTDEETLQQEILPLTLAVSVFMKVKKWNQRQLLQFLFKMSKRPSEQPRGPLTT